MLAMILKILGLLGIIFLVILGVLLLILLLVLFFPITYKAFGRKKEEEITARLKINWLFGLLRVRFAYPKPGNLTVKALCFTLYDSQKEKAKAKNADDSGRKEADTRRKESDTGQAAGDTAHRSGANKNEADDNKARENTARENAAKESVSEENNTKASDAPQKSILEKIADKYNHIKYTISKICGKIKHILENLEFYKSLFEEKQTKELMKYASGKIGKVLRHIRPRKFNADCVVGTGEPDITGYILGFYGMISPALGEHVTLVPDFTRQVYDGEVNAEGRVCIFVVLINCLSLMLDKRLQSLIQKIKKHIEMENENGR